MQKDKAKLIPLVDPKLLIAFAAIMFSTTAYAGDARYIAETAKIKVTSISPQVQDRLDKASPEQRRTLDKAIHTGNLFVKEHFSHNAYDTAIENMNWYSDVAPLLTMDRESWVQYVDTLGMTVKDIPQGGHSAVASRMTCPQISLVSVAQQGEIVNLTYRTHAVGMLIGQRWKDVYDFSAEGAGGVYELGIELDKDALVSKVSPSDKLDTVDYTALVFIMKEFLKYREPVYPPTRAHEKEKVRAYKNTIRMMEESARHHCN